MNLKINRNLLPMKLFYAFYYSAYWLFLPFFPHFLRQKGYTAADLTILIGLMQFILMFSKPMIGNFADKFRSYKTALLLCLSMGAIFISALYFVPPVEIIPTEDSMDAINDTNVSYSFHGNSSWTSFVNDSQRPPKFLDLLVKDPDDDENVVVGHVPQKTPQSTHFGTYHFWLTLALFISAQGFGMSPSFTLMDTVTLITLKDKPQNFGKQRMWMSFGTIISVPLVGFITDQVSQSATVINYAPSFIATIFFICLSAACVLFVKYSVEDVPAKNGDTGPRKGMLDFLPVLKNWRVLLFVFMDFIYGLNFGKSLLMTTPYMKEMQATQLNVSLGLVSSSLAIMAMTFLSGSIIERIGHEMSLCLCLFSFSIRAAMWSVVPSPWFATLTESLLGFSLGLWIPTYSSYAKKIAPPGTEASAASFICGTFEGFGAAVGNISSGFIYYYLGGVFLWRLFSCGTFFFAIFYFTILILKHNHEGSRIHVKETKVPKITDHVESGLKMTAVP